MYLYNSTSIDLYTYKIDIIRLVDFFKISTAEND